ncbi:hypothetical protein F52700_1323 [Fusarium sp. NRRL 52700]|nr:hypothetical protein F52700_1323 [Fusarium sp. NRRL 52700]
MYIVHFHDSCAASMVYELHIRGLEHLGNCQDLYLDHSRRSYSDPAPPSKAHQPEIYNPTYERGPIWRPSNIPETRNTYWRIKGL